MPTNLQVHLVNRPRGEASLTDFRIVKAEVPALAPDQVLVRNDYLSLDPYMRGRMNEGKSYTQPQPLNEVMQGGTAGEVVQSRHPSFTAGDKVVGYGGWQHYCVFDGSKSGALRKVNTSRVPLSYFLGAVGMPGVTAWYGLEKILMPKPGDTLVISAASGAVGSAFGTLAKERQCRVVGIAGGREKCDYVVEDLGFDSCIDYRVHSDIAQMNNALKQVCPKGIDGYFENVGGYILDAVLQRMNAFGRIALCGLIAGYEGHPVPIENPQLLLMNRLKLEGFIVGEHPEVWPAALDELEALAASGKLHPRESISDGLESAPGSFLGLLKGRNFGKQLVRMHHVERTAASETS